MDTISSQIKGKRYRGFFARAFAVFFLTFSVYWLAGESAGSSQKVKRLSVYDKAGDWKIQSLDGKEIPFLDCKGKVVFLNFWATWCKPCLEEMPDIAKLCENLKKDNVLFLLISDEKKETVQRFMKKHRIDLPVYLTKKKPPKIFKTRQLPMTYLLDREGGIAFRCTGITSWSDPAYEKLLRGLTKK